MLVKSNLAAGGSEDDFTTPPTDISGNATGPGFINLHGLDTKGKRIAVHDYDVALIDASDLPAATDPEILSEGTFNLKNHASA